ncbi:hypothetical protein E2320_000962, partial [Naja naja]
MVIPWKNRGVLLLKTSLFAASAFGGCSFAESSQLALSAGPNGGSVPKAVVWSVLFSCRARFLENLAASQKEKISAISRGRAEVLAEAVSKTEPVAP